MRVKPPIHKQFLCIGHPRCGTGYTAHLLSAMGWDVGHETMGKDGISSWMLTVNRPAYPWGNIGPDNPIGDYQFRTLVHVVRDPITALPSIMLENRFAPERKSLRFRIESIRSELGVELADLYENNSTPDLADELELAGRSYVLWNRLCALRKPALTFRVEHDISQLSRFNRCDWQQSEADRLFRNSNKPYQGIRREKFAGHLTQNHLKLLSADLRTELLAFRKTMDYGPFKVWD